MPKMLMSAETQTKIPTNSHSHESPEMRSNRWPRVALFVFPMERFSEIEYAVNTFVLRVRESRPGPEDCDGLLLA